MLNVHRTEFMTRVRGILAKCDEFHAHAVQVWGYTYAVELLAGEGDERGIRALVTARGDSSWSTRVDRGETRKGERGFYWALVRLVNEPR